MKRSNIIYSNERLGVIETEILKNMIERRVCTEVDHHEDREQNKVACSCAR